MLVVDERHWMSVQLLMKDLTGEVESDHLDLVLITEACQQRHIYSAAVFLPQLVGITESVCVGMENM